ncbi:cytokine receptor common subunit beta [Pempheris klunzingeri]|uniref:cytokine receptor common subunit beta n=1 Tax=Pempheris klunzingeri TaxID=3127111 RepID=UPI0039806340
MPLLWVVLGSILPPLALFSGPDRCTFHESSSLQNESPLLKSLQCYNDYESYVHCKWREHGNTSLQVWFKTNNNREQCVPYGAAVEDASEHRTVQCRYKTQAFAIGNKHTVFFLKRKTEALCSSITHRPLDLSQHLRALPPATLSTHDADGRGRRLTWSSPYPSSSSLNKNLKYQLSYRADREDNWTTEDVTNTSVTLEKRLLLPGRMYEARVRARASVGQWSHWSPVVTWQTEEDAGQLPSLHCVLNGEKEVMCSWKVSRELAHFITYQLACRGDQAAPSERCCVNPAVSADLSGTILRYSCSLTVAEPAHLQLELLPTRNAKIFQSSRHIRPNPPQQVNVRETDSNWKVEWTKPSTASKLRLCYHVRYHRVQDQGPSVQVNISGSTFLTILEASLAPSQRYQVQVRSLIFSGEGSMYDGIPSEWTDPEEWTTNEATWSPTTLIYIFIGVFAATVVLTLYFTIPACQRKVILWGDSVPSPGKSKILSDIKSATNWTLVQSESTSMSKVQHLDGISSCSSDTSLWPTKDTEKMGLEKYKGCWKCDSLPSPGEKANSPDTSSMSFSGPYIFCQSSEQNCKSVDVKSEEKEKEKESQSDDSPSPVNITLYGKGYVCLPSRSVSRSMQDLVSRGDGTTNTQRHDGAEQNQQRPDVTLWTDKRDVQPGLSEPTSSQEPTPYTSGLFTPWPQGGTIHASGYCHLPQMRAEK